MFFYGRQAGCNFSSVDKDGQGRRKGKGGGDGEKESQRGRGRGRERAGGVERGSPASPCQGFPHSHLGCVNPRLAQAHSWILTSPRSLPFSLSFFPFFSFPLSLPMSPQHLPHCLLLPPIPDNEYKILFTRSRKSSSAEGRHFLETVANNSRELLSLSGTSGRKAGSTGYLSVCTANGLLIEECSLASTSYVPVQQPITAQIFMTPIKNHTWVCWGSVNKSSGPLMYSPNMNKIWAVTTVTWLMNLLVKKTERKKGFHKIICQLRSKWIKSTCHVINRDFTQPARTAGFKNSARSEVNKLISGLWLLICS